MASLRFRNWGVPGLNWEVSGLFCCNWGVPVFTTGKVDVAFLTVRPWEVHTKVQTLRWRVTTTPEVFRRRKTHSLFTSFDDAGWAHNEAIGDFDVSGMEISKALLTAMELGGGGDSRQWWCMRVLLTFWLSYPLFFEVQASWRLCRYGQWTLASSASFSSCGDIN